MQRTNFPLGINKSVYSYSYVCVCVCVCVCVFKPCSAAALFSPKREASQRGKNERKRQNRRIQKAERGDSRSLDSVSGA